MATDDPIRASDADRDVVVDVLREAYTEGRLTADEFDGSAAVMTARVNGEERSRGNLADLHYSWADILAQAARNTELRPGDVIGSGTVRVQYYGNEPVFKEQEKAFRAIANSLLKFNAQQAQKTVSPH